ncbi:NS3 [Orungo virus]|uniref:NS3 n=1 Tax=Orungo virus TaxID=40058 RepID=W5QLX7_9REOV
MYRDLLNIHTEMRGPPSYEPSGLAQATAPTMRFGDREDEEGLLRARELSLNVLTNAMTNTTGANEAIKNEKAMFGAYADALRDTPEIRVVKRRINERTLEKLHKMRRSLHGRRMFVRMLLAINVGLALLTSAVNVVRQSLDDFGKERWIVGGVWWLGEVVVTINFGTTVATLVLMRIHGALNAQLQTIKRDIYKKSSYNEAAAMHWKGEISLIEELAASHVPAGSNV